MSTEANGWAIKQGGRIDILTVYDTRRGAIVNFLWARKGFTILNSDSDERIEQLWSDYQRECVSNMATAVEVTIAEKRPQ